MLLRKQQSLKAAAFSVTGAAGGDVSTSGLTSGLTSLPSASRLVSEAGAGGAAEARAALVASVLAKRQQSTAGGMSSTGTSLGVSRQASLSLSGTGAGGMAPADRAALVASVLAKRQASVSGTGRAA